MKPQRPYLFDAIYRWILDNSLTPYLLVNAEFSDEVIVPRHLVNDGQIVLNLSPEAIDGYCQDDTGISFSARFSGQSQALFIPFQSMLALYAKETAKGIVFPPEDFPPDDPGEKLEVPSDPGLSEKQDKKEGESDRPSLKVIK